MAKIMIEVDTFEWHYVRTRDRFSLGESELDDIFRRMGPEQNPLGMKAPELRDYLDGKGELALKVELAGTKNKVDETLDAIASWAAEGCFELRHVSHEVVGFKDGDPPKCHRAYVKLER